MEELFTTSFKQINAHFQQVFDDLARGRDLDLDAGFQHVRLVRQVEPLSLIHI